MKDRSSLDALTAADYQAVVEHSLDGVMFTIPDGRVLYANPAACAILRASEETLLSLGRQGISDPSDDRWAASLHERLERGHVRFMATMVRPDGSRFVADISSTLFASSNGELRSSVVFRDVTERLRLEQRLEALNVVHEWILRGRAVPEVLRLIAHRAASLVNATDAAVMIPAEPPGSVTIMLAEGDRMSELVGRRYPPGSLAAEAMSSQQSRIIDDLTSEAVSEDGRQLQGRAMLVPIIAGKGVFGNLLLRADATNPRYTQADLAVAEMFARSAGLALEVGEARTEAERRNVAEAELRVWGDLATELLDSPDLDRTYSHAKALGCDLSRSYRVLLVERGGSDIGALAAAVRRAALRVSLDAQLMAQRAAGLVLIIPGDAEWLALSSEIGREAGQLHRLGVGGVHEPGLLGRSLIEAEQALRLGKGNVARFEELGIWRYLVTDADADWLADLVEQHIFNLIAYDAAHRSELLLTLSTFLQHNGGIEGAAAFLHIHPSTLKYRLARIEHLTGRNLRDPDDRFGLELACRAYSTMPWRLGSGFGGPLASTGAREPPVADELAPRRRPQGARRGRGGLTPTGTDASTPPGVANRVRRAPS